MILDRLPAEHTDTPLLKELHGLLSNHEGDFLPEGRVDELKQQLELSHYVYQSLQDVRRDGKGLLLSQAYLADGIENFDHAEWEELKPAFRGKYQSTHLQITHCDTPSYLCFRKNAV